MAGVDDASVLVDEESSRDRRHLEFLCHAGFPIAGVKEHEKIVAALIQEIENALGPPLDIDADDLKASSPILLVKLLDLGHGTSARATLAFFLRHFGQRLTRGDNGKERHECQSTQRFIRLSPVFRDNSILTRLHRSSKHFLASD
jgi:hypothetical protein